MECVQMQTAEIFTAQDAESLVQAFVARLEEAAAQATLRLEAGKGRKPSQRTLPIPLRDQHSDDRSDT
jgi:hypothetical protein